METERSVTSSIVIPEPPKAEIPLPLGVNMFCAWLAGSLAWIVVHPFEVSKNKIMMSPPTTPLRVSLAEASRTGFYRGLTGGLARQVVYTSCRLGLYDPVKHVIVGPCPEKQVTIFERAAAGAISGVLAGFCSSPVEVCLAYQIKSHRSLSLFGASQEVMSHSGVLGFWRGAVPLLTRAAIVGISQVAMYDQSRNFIEDITDYGQPGKEKMSHHSIVVSASLITGLFYSVVTMPIELARVRMSVNMIPGVEKGGGIPNMAEVLRRIVKTEGSSTIFKSFLPYFMRCSVHTVTCFFILDEFLRFAHDREDKTR
eukprot:Tbor_TRINITY_DN3114_c0_g1::TRINITY_DN3114_c0_g1_i1::g.14780::m.14780/K15104/SLC25A11, OGC; solute carrier family 25 (mitochondrial oxoglutarate transporter), member 11